MREPDQKEQDNKAQEQKEQDIILERQNIYLDSLGRGNGPFLDALEKRAIEDRIPVIRPAMQRLLKVLLAAAVPHRILEVGTATGFSALLMASYTEDFCRITTIERDRERICLARENISQAGMENRICLLEGEAEEILDSLSGSFDMIFMDAAKGQYIYFLPRVLELLAPGGMLISDNVLREGDILESHYIVERRNRTIYRRMREYLCELTHREDLVTTILTEADGIALTVKKK